jgi:hypothetical protein
VKTCTTCNETKPISEFRKYGGRCRDSLRPLCKVCQREYERGWRSQTKEYRAAARQRRKAKAKEYANQYLSQNRAKYLVAECRRRSARRGLAFDLDQHTPEIQTRIDQGRCELSEVPLKTTMGPMAFDSPSIDRIDPSKGYVYSNIRVVCRAMNCALGDWGEEVLARVVSGWLARR